MDVSQSVDRGGLGLALGAYGARSIGVRSKESFFELVVPIKENGLIRLLLGVFPMNKYGKNLKDRTSCEGGCISWFIGPTN
ncbi:MAG: hypothetical protein RR311_17960 [Comamonas sp.]